MDSLHVYEIRVLMSFSSPASRVVWWFKVGIRSLGFWYWAVSSNYLGRTIIEEAINISTRYFRLKRLDLLTGGGGLFSFAFSTFYFLYVLRLAQFLFSFFIIITIFFKKYLDYNNLTPFPEIISMTLARNTTFLV